MPPPISFSGSDAAVQRVIRRAWQYGNFTWFWRLFFDNIFHQYAKAITIAIYEDMQNYNGVSIDQSTESELPKIPNDPEVID